jgi:hypothetical protein
MDGEPVYVSDRFGGIGGDWAKRSPATENMPIKISVLNSVRI